MYLLNFPLTSRVHWVVQFLVHFTLLYCVRIKPAVPSSLVAASPSFSGFPHQHAVQVEFALRRITCHVGLHVHVSEFGRVFDPVLHGGRRAQDRRGAPRTSARRLAARRLAARRLAARRPASRSGARRAFGVPSWTAATGGHAVYGGAVFHRATLCQKWLGVLAGVDVRRRELAAHGDHRPRTGRRPRRAARQHRAVLARRRPERAHLAEDGARRAVLRNVPGPVEARRAEAVARVTVGTRERGPASALAGGRHSALCSAVEGRAVYWRGPK